MWEAMEGTLPVGGDAGVAVVLAGAESLAVGPIALVRVPVVALGARLPDPHHRDACSLHQPVGQFVAPVVLFVHLRRADSQPPCTRGPILMGARSGWAMYASR
jgi:hypothetical protein